jgi:hypothetical protein
MDDEAFIHQATSFGALRAIGPRNLKSSMPKHSGKRGHACAANTHQEKLPKGIEGILCRKLVRNFVRLSHRAAAISIN